MFTRVCCCDIKVAVLVLGILTMIATGISTAVTASAVSFYIFMGSYSLLSISNYFCIHGFMVALWKLTQYFI